MGSLEGEPWHPTGSDSGFFWFKAEERGDLSSFIHFASIYWEMILGQVLGIAYETQREDEQTQFLLSGSNQSKRY